MKKKNDEKYGGGVFPYTSHLDPIIIILEFNKMIARE
jgi:hypothetical protein